MPTGYEIGAYRDLSRIAAAMEKMVKNMEDMVRTQERLVEYIEQKERVAP